MIFKKVINICRCLQIFFDINLYVTGIIGQNGSGKSNVLDFIKKNLVEGNNSPDDIAIVAFRQHEKLYLILPEVIDVIVDSPGIDIQQSQYPLRDLKDTLPEVSFF